MQLQVLTDTLRTQQLHTLQTHVTHDLGLVGLAVVRGEAGRGITDGRGRGRQEGAGVRVLIGCGSMQTGVFLIQKVHVLCDPVILQTRTI